MSIFLEVRYYYYSCNWCVLFLGRTHYFSTDFAYVKLLNITSKFSAVAMFVVADLQTVWY
jgi:hypothetical protein